MGSRTISAVLVLGATGLAALARAQIGFNIDLDLPTDPPLGGGPPSSSFGAAAGQPGFWCSVMADGNPPLQLHDLSGQLTNVIITGPSGGVGGGDNFTGNTGDFALLLNDGNLSSNSRWSFSGVPNGFYDVYTYTVWPDSLLGYTSAVFVSDSISPNPQYVYGPMPGNQFILGQTHSIHLVQVTSGTLSIEVDWNGSHAAYVNGFQIVPAPRQVSGSVTLGDYPGQVAGMPVTVEIRNPGSTTPIDREVVALDVNGNFAFHTAVPPGTYDFAAKGSHWLRETLASRVMSGSGVSGLNYSLVNGDINGDNVVSLVDFYRLRVAFGSSPGAGNWNPNADLNGDMSVSLADFSILRANYSRQGDP